MFLKVSCYKQYNLNNDDHSLNMFDVSGSSGISREHVPELQIRKGTHSNTM